MSYFGTRSARAVQLRAERRSAGVCTVCGKTRDHRQCVTCARCRRVSQGRESTNSLAAARGPVIQKVYPRPVHQLIRRIPPFVRGSIAYSFFGRS